jgi:hypothetical protein
MESQDIKPIVAENKSNKWMDEDGNDKDSEGEPKDPYTFKNFS